MELKQDTPPAARQLLRFVGDAVTALLPAGWRGELDGNGRGGSPALVITAPDNRSVSMPVEVRSVLDARDVPTLAAQYGAGAAPLVVARYLSSRSRAALAEIGASYVDATGNVRVCSVDPGITIWREGAERDPWRTPDRPTTTLRGVPAARVVRALVDRKPPWKIRELAAESGASLASTSRTVALLGREALLTRGESGEVATVDWAALLERWAADYDLERRRRVAGLLQPRPLDTLNEALRKYRGEYAITGSLAAARWAPYADSRLAIIYAADLPALATALNLREAPTRPNVLLIEPDDDYVFDRAQASDGLTYAAPSQVVVDLLNGPGRNPEEGLELTRWMTAHEKDWRA